MWLVVGFLGQFIFSLRFFIQWLVSEKNKKSHIPLVFWYLSLAGGLILLVYAIHRHDPVFIIGQSFGIVVYIRNLILIQNQQTEQMNYSFRKGKL